MYTQRVTDTICTITMLHTHTRTNTTLFITHFIGLLLKGIQDAVDELLLQPRVNIGSTQITHNLNNNKDTHTHMM